jgi:O-antigen ligase
MLSYQSIKRMLKATTIQSRLFYGLIILIIFLPLPLGSNRIWAWSIIEAWIFCLSALTIISLLHRKITVPEHAKRCKLPLISLAGFLAVSLFQLLPLNTALPKSIDILNEHQWLLFSLDPYATLQASIKTFSFLCLFILVVILVNTERRIKTVLMYFFLSGLFQAVYGSLMTLTEIEHIFFMEKYAYIGKATGTFINRNHYANYLILCIAAGTALLLMDISNRKSSGIRDSLVGILHFIMSTKMLLRIGLAVCVVGIVLSQSRMGNTSFFVSLSIAGFLWMLLTKRFTKKSFFLLASFIIIDLFIVGQWFGFDEVQQRLQNTSAQAEKRDEVAKDTINYIKDYLLIGSGGGSYYSVYPNYQSDDVRHFYKHAHNDYLQFLSEYGVIGTFFIALFALSSTYISLSTMIKRRNKTMQATAFCSLMVIIALLLHSSVDFSLQITANAASTVIIIGLSWVACHLKSSRSGKARKRKSP